MAGYGGLLTRDALLMISPMARGQGLHLQISINIITLTLLIVFFNQVFVQFVFHNVQSGSLKDFFRFECSSQFVSAQWHCFTLGHLVLIAKFWTTQHCSLLHTVLCFTTLLQGALLQLIALPNVGLYWLLLQNDECILQCQCAGQKDSSALSDRCKHFFAGSQVNCAKKISVLSSLNAHPISLAGRWKYMYFDLFKCGHISQQSISAPSLKWGWNIWNWPGQARGRVFPLCQSVHTQPTPSENPQGFSSSPHFNPGLNLQIQLSICFNLFAVSHTWFSC